MKDLSALLFLNLSEFESNKGFSPVSEVIYFPQLHSILHSPQFSSINSEIKVKMVYFH